MTMNKGDLIAIIEDAAECSHAKALRAYDGLVEAIANRLSNGTEVHFRGVGTLSREATRLRRGRNPRTGESILIPAGFRIKFKAAKPLRDKCQTCV